MASAGHLSVPFLRLPEMTTNYSEISELYHSLVLLFQVRRRLRMRFL